MPGPDTFAVALVRAVRANGARPAAPGPGAPTWAAVAGRARRLALGLSDVGVAGVAIAVEPAGAPHEVFERELAVLASGAVLVVGDAPAEGRLSAGSFRSGRAFDDAGSVEELLARGDEVDRLRPAAYEEGLARLEPSAPALLSGGREVTHGQARWALRSVDRWLGSASGPTGPQRCASGPSTPGHRVASALIGRWWPATTGAALVGCGDDVVATLRSTAPDMVVLDGPAWDEVAAALRSTAGRSLGGPAVLRRGRAVVGGESSGRADRLALAAARRWAGPRLRTGSGVEGLAIGVSLGPLAPLTGRDLAAAAVRVAATWIEPGVPAPVAAGPVGRPAPATRWVRPLPGRSVEPVDGHTVVGGGDLSDGRLVVTVPTSVDDRGRVDPRHRRVGRTGCVDGGDR